MEFREDVSFNLKGCSPVKLCALPSQGCLLVASAVRGLRMLDLVSGTQLKDVAMTHSNLQCCYHQQSGKLVVGGGRYLGVRGPTEGSVMLGTILQPPAADTENIVTIELPQTQAEVLWCELKGAVLPRSWGLPGNRQLSDRILAQLESGVSRSSEAASKMTVSFEGPVHQLYSLFDDLLAKMRTPRGGPVPYTPAGSSGSPSPALPVVAAIALRLRLLHPDHHPVLRQLEEGCEVKDQKIVFSEAVRRMSLRKWPHKNYVWAVPSTMAEAGFFHLPNTQPHMTSGLAKADRVSCFTCHIYLYSWEPNDEPWSEHERHAVQCPFMRGEPTDNVPLDVTEGSHPAVLVTSDPNDSIEFVSVSPHSNLVAVATKQGVLSIWDVSGSLCILPQARLELTRESLQLLLCSHTHTQQEDEISAFSLTSLALISTPGHTPSLVTAVTVTHPTSSSHSFLLIHSIVDTHPSQSSPGPPPIKGAAPLIHPQLSQSVLLPLDTDLSSLPDEQLPEQLPSFPVPVLPPHPPSFSTALHDLLVDPADTTARVGLSLVLASLLPLSSLLPDLHDNYEVQVLHPLTASPLLAVYVTRDKPHPPSAAEVKGDDSEPSNDKMNSVEVKGHDNEGPYGCLMLVRYEEKGRGSLVPVVRRVTMSSGDVVVDVCHVTVSRPETNQSRDLLVVVTTQGELQLLDIDTLQVVTSYGGECGYISCIAWSDNGGRVAVVTRGERVVVMRVCEEGGGGGEGGEEEEERNKENINAFLGERLSPAAVEGLLSLTYTSPVGVAYTGSAPQHWKEISLQQFHRKIPTHMHSAPDPSGVSHTPQDHTQVWQYAPPPSVISGDRNQANNNFNFELSLNPSSPAVGCVSVHLSLPTARCLGDEATVSLLLPSRETRGGRRDKRGRWMTHDIRQPEQRVLCGPVRLKPLVDVTGCAVQVSFTHPLLLSSPLPPTLGLRLDQLFSVDYREVVMTAAEANAPTPAKTTGLRRRGAIIRHGNHHRLQTHVNTKPHRAVPEQCYLSLSLYPLTHQSQPTTPINTLLRLINERVFLLNVILGACLYRVTRREWESLPSPLQALVNGGGREGEEREGEGGGLQLQCLQLLCWVSHLQDGVSGEEGIEMVRGMVGRLLVSLFHACFIASHSRQTAHYCSRLIVCLHRPQEVSPSAEVFGQQLLRALPPLLPLLPLCPSAACVHWLLRVVLMVVVKSHDRHVIMQHCMEVLVELAKQLQTKTGHLPQLLHTHYGHDGSVLDDGLYDIYLSYFQKSIKSVPNIIVLPPSVPPSSSINPLVAQPWGTSETDTNATYVPAKYPSQVPPLAPPSLAASSGEQVLYTHRKYQTIYDAELKLLLNSPPSATPDRVRRLLAEFPPFQHGSFLLYGQRGLLETFPLQYSCCSVSGSARVQEPVYGNETQATATPPQMDFTSPGNTSGYFYPTGHSRDITRTSHSFIPYGTPQSYPNEFTSSASTAKDLVMYVDVLQSGKVYAAVLKFNQPVYLTDISISTNPSMGCVSVDVWLGEEGGEGGEDTVVRLALCTEIGEKSLMLGNLMPPPLCQFVKVTYTGKLGANRERAQAFLGTFYGIPVMSPNDPPMAEILAPLEQQLMKKYSLARDQLRQAVIAATTDKASLTNKHDNVNKHHQTCFLAQTRLARLRHYIRREGEAPVIRGEVFAVEEAAASVDYVQLSLSQLYRLAGCLVNTMLVLCGTSKEPESPTFTEELPELPEANCHLLLSTLCVHGDLRLQARSCGLLLSLCSSQPWWGDMLVAAATQLFSSNHISCFNRDRAMLQLSALCQRSYQHSPVLTCLLRSLSSLLSPSPCPDPSQLQLMVLLLTHILSSLHTSRHSGSSDPNLFSPILTIPQPTENKQQPPPKPPSQGVKRTAIGSRRGLRAVRRQPATPINHVQPPSSTPPSSPLPSLPTPLTHDVIRGLLAYAISLIEQKNWGMLPVVCKVITLLSEFSSEPLPITSLLTTSQLTLLLSTACTSLQHRHGNRHDNHSPSNIPGHLQWACRGIQWMVMSLLYFGDIMPYLDQCQREREEREERGERATSEREVLVRETDLPVREEVEMISRGSPGVKVSPGVEGSPGPEESLGVKGGPKKYGDKGEEDGEEEAGEGKDVGEMVQVQGLPVFTSKQEWEENQGDLESDKMYEEWKSADWLYNQNTEDILPSATTTGESFIEPLLLHTIPGSIHNPILGPIHGLIPVPIPTQIPGTNPLIDTSDLKPVSTLPPFLSIPSLSITPFFSVTDTPPPPLPLTVKFTKAKKLSKHHVKSHKYAPGDYTQVPIIRPPPDASQSLANADPYRAFLISSTVDYRLQHSLVLPAELALQNTAKRQYDAILWSLVTAGNCTLTEGSGRVEERGGGGRGHRVMGDEEELRETCVFVRESLSQLLSSVSTPRQSSLDAVTVLQLWSELNTLFSATPTQSSGGSGPLGGSGPPRGQKFECLCSTEMLGMLMHCLLSDCDHTPCDHAPSKHAVFQVGLTLFHQFISHLSADLVLPLVPSHLSTFLSSYFINEDAEEVGVEGGVVSNFFKELIPLKLVGARRGNETKGSDGEDVTGGGEGVTTGFGVERGVHVLLQLLVDLLQHRSYFPALHPLLEALGTADVPRLLFSSGPDQCSRAVTCIFRLLADLTSLVRSTQNNDTECPWQYVKVYGADVDSDRMRYHRNRNGGGIRIKWVPVSCDSAQMSKVTSDVIQLVRQLLSDCSSDSAHKAVEGYVKTGVKIPSLPLLLLVYGDSHLLKEYFSLLCTVGVEDEGKQASPAPWQLLDNFLHFLYNNCPDKSIFFRPVLDALADSAKEHVPMSKPFLCFVGRLTSDLATDGNHQYLDRFVAEGGARLVFECFVLSSQSPSLLPSSSGLDSTILYCGQQTTLKPFQDGSQLVNYLPLAKVHLSPGYVPIQDLQSNQGDPPSRSSVFHHTFQPQDKEVVLTATLPHPILLYSLQLFQPLGSLQNGPSSVFIEVSSGSRLAPPIPATPTINTKGLSCIKIDLDPLVVAQEVRVHLHRPFLSDSISLSHLYMLGVEYGGPPRREPDDKKSITQCSPCSNWLAIVDRWLCLPEDRRLSLVREAATVPQLLPTCLSLITTHHHTLSLKLSNQLHRLLLALARHHPDHAQTIIQYLLGLSSEATPTTTPTAVELFHCLCIPITEANMQRLAFCLRLLSQVKMPPPMLVRALASAVWHGDPQCVTSVLSEELFSSLAEATLSSIMESPLKSSLNSLLCALCSHAPHHFTLLLDRCLKALSIPPHLPPDLPPLLVTLAHVAQSPACSPVLLSSLLLSAVVTELRETFTGLVAHLTEDTPTKDHHSNEMSPQTPLLQRSCVLLAFMTDFARGWAPAKAWVGREEQVDLWLPLLQFLSQAESQPHFISSCELSFVQDVGIEFFQAVLQDNIENKTLFSRLLTNSLCGSFYMATLAQPRPQTTLTNFTHRVIIDLALDPEPVTVLLQSDSTDDGASLSLPLTHTSSTFHPSLPVSRNSHLIALPPTFSVSHITALCQTHAQRDDDRSKGTSTKRATPPTDIRSHNASMKSLVPVKKTAPPPNSDPLNPLSVSSEAAPISTSMTVNSSFSISLSSSSETTPPLSAHTKLSELLTSNSSPLHVLPLTVHFSPRNKKSPPPPPLPPRHSPPPPPPPSLLETFSGAGGLVLLSHCLPFLSTLGEESSSSPGDQLYSLSSGTTDTPSSHMLITFGLCLRLRCYGDALMDHLPVARSLLKMLMGAECKESETVSDHLQFMPYLLLLKTLRNYPADNEVGVACRKGVMRERVIHQLLMTLASFGHLPRSRHTVTAPESDRSASSQAVPRPGQGGTVSGHRLYWAKGTGFGTGSTQSTWNVDAMRAKQRVEEKHICLCFAILCEFLSVTKGRGQGAGSWCDPALADLLADSCLLPAMVTYLVNDSILDISKHMDLYQAALGLLYAMTFHPSLLPLLVVPVFSNGDPASSSGRDGLTLLSISKHLKKTVLSYVHMAKNTRMKSKTGSKTTPTDTPVPLPLPIPPRRVKVQIDTVSSLTSRDAEAELAELTSAMLATAERVVATVPTGGVGGGEGADKNEAIPLRTTDNYLQAMRSLQFDTYKFLDEDESGTLNFHIPFHYESRLESSLGSVSRAARARRLVQEVSSLSTSLPLSSSSSVFVRCDEERLDVMKVLITGPSDTPYANGCFEFDVFFPLEYPEGPMLVNLMTTGQGTVRFNPNLYNDGKVCLSVLNTWHGRPEEKWNSETSSFLQVLVSLQSLVLVPDPFFNEPGYEQYRGTQYGDQRSLLYNANLYLATVQWAMLDQLQNPSPCFREVILKHFLLRRDEVVAQCRQWERSLADGIENMQAQGMATAQLKNYLRKLMKSVQTLGTEIGKIEKKLQKGSGSHTRSGDTGPSDSDPSSYTGHPESLGSDPIFNIGHPKSSDSISGHTKSKDDPNAGPKLLVDTEPISCWPVNFQPFPPAESVEVDVEEYSFYSSDSDYDNAGHLDADPSSNTGQPKSVETEPSSNTGHPELVDTDPSSNTGHPELGTEPNSKTGHPKLDTDPSSNTGHPESEDSNIKKTIHQDSTSPTTQSHCTPTSERSKT